MVRVACSLCRKSPQACEFEAGLCRATTGKLCLPSSKWAPFSNQARIGSERRRMGSAIHLLCTRYSGTLTPTAPTAIRFDKPLQLRINMLITGIFAELW